MSPTPTSLPSAPPAAVPTAAVDDVADAFFARLPPLHDPHHAFDDAAYHAAPDDWVLAVTDIVGSTAAIAAGRHKTVNFVAAMAIAAARNLCAPAPIPFLFGGDGAVLMVPPRRRDALRQALARVRGAAQREHGLRLRVGLAPVSALRELGFDVRVARYEPTPGNSFGVFAGGGIGVLEDAIRGRAWPGLGALADVPPALDDGAPVDLSGLSCRWAPLQSQHGKMLTLIVHGAEDPGALFAEVMRLARQDGDPRPARPETLRTTWPPEGFMLEARARSRGGWLPWWALRVLAETLLARLVLARDKPVGAFDPVRYRQEIRSNTDFCKFDRTLCMVLDCALPRIEAIRALVAQQAAVQRFEWGMTVSDTALMTCLVTAESDGLHVHFIDGGGGGYTQAARQMKAARTAAG
jgi:hypothetical protein